MQKKISLFITVIVLLSLSSCTSAKYTKDRVLGDQSEFGPFQTRVGQDEKSDIPLANADAWVKKHFW